MKIDNVSEENLEDIFKICEQAFHLSPDDPDYQLYKKGVELKRRWVKDRLKRNIPCIKIAYLDGKPLSKIQFFPEELIPYISNPRKNVVSILCTYNPFPSAQRTGIASSLLENLVDECKSGEICIAGVPCRFLVTRPFPEEGKTSLIEFYTKNGFRPGYKEMFLTNIYEYVSRENPDYHPYPGDLEKTIMFYNPACEWGYFYAYKVKEIIHALDPAHTVELFDIWESPDEFIKRSIQRVTSGRAIVKGHIMPGGIFWTDRSAFNSAVENALNQ